MQAYLCIKKKIVSPYDNPPNHAVKVYQIDKPTHLLSFRGILHSVVFFIALKFSLHRYDVLLEFFFMLGLPLYHLGRGALEAFPGGGGRVRE